MVNADDSVRHQLGNLLRTRRNRISPSEHGFPVSRRRRAPGLLREEVAQLAGMSLAWYTLLEQGRAVNVSPRLLERLADVLRLDGIERDLLFALARAQHKAPAEKRPHGIDPKIQTMIDLFAFSPAVIIDRAWDIHAWNRAASTALFDFSDVRDRPINGLAMVFTHAPTQAILGDWRIHARATLARFRADYDRNAGDPRFLELVERLKRESPDFTRWWQEHDIHPQVTLRQESIHPKAGKLIWEHSSLSFEEYPELRLELYTPANATSLKKTRALIAPRSLL